MSLESFIQGFKEPFFSPEELEEIQTIKDSLKNKITILNQNPVFNWEYDGGWLAIPLLEEKSSLFSLFLTKARNEKDEDDFDDFDDFYLLPFPDGTIHKIFKEGKNDKFADLGEIDNFDYLRYGPSVEEKIEDMRKVVEESRVL